MTTRRQNILSNISTVLGTVGELTAIYTNRVLPVTEDDMPLANITSGNEALDLENSDLGQETWVWSVPIIVLTKTTDIETLLGVIQIAVSADDTRGGNADITQRVGAEMVEDFDLPKGVQAMTIFFEITYEIPRGTA